MRTQRQISFLLALCVRHCFQHNSISFDPLSQWLHTHFYHIHRVYRARQFMSLDSRHRRPLFSNTCLCSGSLRRSRCLHTALLGGSLPLVPILGCNNWPAFLPPDIFLLQLRPFNASYRVSFILEQWFSTGVILSPRDVWQYLETFWIITAWQGLEVL